jgi:hypothetical protein
MVSIRQLGMTALIAVVALRVGIGLHFYMEGAAKIRDPVPYSANFLLAAKGQFAPLFRSLVWDPDGLERLDQDQTLQIWDHYLQRSIDHYGLSGDDAKAAQQAFKQRKGQLDWWISGNKTEIADYRKGLERRNRYWQQNDRMQVASLRGQVATIERELGSKRSALIGPIDQIWNGYVEDLRRLGKRRHALAITKPNRRALDSESIDRVIRYFDVAVGALLILGLFTRAAAAAAALFLCSVVVSQWPGAWGAIPVWPQFIEMLGLVVLAAVGAGRFDGLDFLLSSVRCWCCPPKQGSES